MACLHKRWQFLQFVLTLIAAFVRSQAEYYDLHPKHLDNIDEKFTLDYLPPGKNSYVIGPHEDSSKSIRVPFCSMRLWYLHTSGQLELSKILDPLYKPKNTRENFLLYVVSAGCFLQYQRSRRTSYRNSFFLLLHHTEFSLH